MEMSNQDASTTYTCDIIHDEKTGDQILQFPDKMMKQLDWQIDDVLGFEISELGNKTSIVIRNISLEKRKET